MLCLKNNVNFIKKCLFWGQNMVTKWSKLSAFDFVMQKFNLNQSPFYAKTPFCLIWAVMKS
jgi:hypothetical protein